MIPGIGVKIFGKDSLSSKLGAIQKNLNKFGQSAKQIGQTMSIGLTMPMGLLGYNTLKTAGDFEYGMNRVVAITSAAGKEFKMLEDQAKHLGETTTFTAGQVTEGMQMLAQAGLPVEDIYASIGTVLKGAQANMVDMSEAANIGAGLMRTFGYESKDMMTVMDMLTKTSMSSMTNFTDLSEAFLYAGPSAGAMGKTLKETSAVLGSLANGMLRGSMAGTSLRGMMAKLTAPTAEAVKIMQSLGIGYDDVLDKKGNLKSFVDVVKAFENTGITAGQVLQIFGLRAGPGFQILLNQGSEGLKKMMDTVGDFAGTTEKISEVQMAGFRGQMWALKSAFEGFEIAIAQSGILVWATKLGRKITELFRKMAKFHPTLLKTAFIFGLVVAAIGPLLVAVGAISVALAALSWPIVGVVAGIMGMIGAIGVLIYWWDKTVDVVSRFGWALGLALGPIGWLIWASALIIKNWEKIVEVFEAVVYWLKKIPIEKIANIFGGGTSGGLMGLGHLENTTNPEMEQAQINNLLTANKQQVDANIKITGANLPPGTTLESDNPDVITEVERGMAFQQ